MAHAQYQSVQGFAGDEAALRRVPPSSVEPERHAEADCPAPGIGLDQVARPGHEVDRVITEAVREYSGRGDEVIIAGIVVLWQVPVERTPSKRPVTLSQSPTRTERDLRTRRELTEGNVHPRRPDERPVVHVLEHVERVVHTRRDPSTRLERRGVQDGSTEADARVLRLGSMANGQVNGECNQSSELLHCGPL